MERVGGAKRLASATERRDVTVTAYANLLDPLRQRAEREPDRLEITLLYEGGEREPLTAGALYSDAAACAAHLAAAGVGRGDVVLLVMEHSRQLIACFLGALRRGAIPSIVPSAAGARTDPAAYQRRIGSVVGNGRPRCVVTIGERAEALQAVVGPQCRVLIADQLLTSAPAPCDDAAWYAQPNDVAFLQYTSGSGGVSKGVAHRHRTVLRYIDAKRRAQPVRPHEIIVSWLPLYHDLGLVSGLLTPLVLGVRAVLMSPAQWVRRPGVLLRAVHEFRGTLCFMPNFALNHCVRAVREQDLEGIDLSCWDALVCGAEPVRFNSLRAFAHRFAAYGFRESSLRAGYGMAELVEAATVTPAGAPPSIDWVDPAVLQRQQRAERMAPDAPAAVAIVSCGAPLPGTAVDIQDASGVPLAERCLGEICVRSDYMLEAYHREPEMTARAVREGWFHTGDIGYLADGELYVTGRTSDLIIVGGRNLHPEDIEVIVDGVAGVQPGRVVAFGVPDVAAGSERIVVVAELAPGGTVEQIAAIERQVRSQLKRQLEVVVGEVRLVGLGWVVKTSSGKNARRENRDKYLQERADDPDAVGPHGTGPVE
jgi:fatty-acyl-CoA synthase